MNENTKIANSKPRSVKPKKRSGFTLMEMMITLAIMVILFGLAVPAVAQIQKNLEMARLDSYAKDVYLAAQNRLMSLKATGELNSVRDELEKRYSGLEGGRDRYYGDWDEDPAKIFKPQDWDDAWEDRYQNFYGVMHNPTDPGDNDPVITSVIPELSVSNTYLDHHYYIEFNPATGDVYAVFYTDAKAGFSAQDILDLPEDGRTKAYRRDSFANADGEKMMLGYYRGDPTEMLKDQIVDEFEVTCELVNKEDLYVKATGQLDWDSFNHRKYVDTKIILTETKGAVTNTVAIPINLRQADSLTLYDRSRLATNGYTMFKFNPDGTEPYKFVVYVMLDSLDDSADFAALVNNSEVECTAGTKDAFIADFAAGCDMKASITMEYDFAGRVVRNTDDNESELQNSRFGAVVSSGSINDVYVGFVRHLKNLNDYVLPSGNALYIKQIRTEYVLKTVVDETGEEHQELVKEEGPADIYFNAKYQGDTGTKWYWNSTYLVGEPTGDDLRNYMNAPDFGDEAYMPPIHLQLNGNKTFTYEGNYKGLYDFLIVAPEGGDVGLFDSVTRATFSHANLIDATVDGGDAGGISVGGFAGEATNANFYYCGVRLTDRDPVSNKRYTAMSDRVSTYAVLSGGADCIGGMVGYAENCEFDYSYAAVQVEGGDASTAGGMVGYSKTCNFLGCYTSEPTIGGLNVGGFVGMMEGGTAYTEINGNEAYPIYAAGDAIGTGNVGGFVGSVKGPAKLDGCNSFGRARSAEGTTASKLGGFVATHASMPGEAFSNCSYLQQSRYNKGTGFVSQDGLATGRAYDDAFSISGTANNFWNVLADADTNNDNTAANSFPYTIAARADVFPFMMAHEAFVNATTGNVDDYPVMPHYGDWPVEASLQTMLAYYEIYQEDDGSTRYGLYGATSLAGDDEDKANSWKLDTLLRGDVSCVEDGYAIVSTDMLTNISGTIESLNNTTISVDYSNPSSQADVSFTSEGQPRNEHVYIYKLSSLDAQGMSTAYETKMNDQNGTYYQKAILTGKYNGDEMFSNYTFFYCPVLAKSAINPTPKQADDPSLCPTAKAKDNEAKPDAGIIRSARQLNAMGRMNWFWNMDLNQECHVDFGTYVKNYCGTAIDLSGNGQGSTNQWRNKPIGSNTTTYGKKPYTGNYNGNAFKIIDYCLLTSGANDSVDAGLFGVLYKGSIKNVVLMASDPNANSGAGTAWVKSTMTQGNGAYHIAPLVGLVDYNSEAYSAAGSQARSVKSWIINSDAIDRYAIEGNKFSLSGYSSVGDGGRWTDAKRNLAPQNTQQYLEITLKGNFGTVTGASMITTKTKNGSTETYTGPTSASSINDGEIKFRLNMTDCVLETSPETVDPETGVVTPASSKRNVGDDIVITLTGGSTENWLVSESSFKAELFSTEPVIPSGDDPANFITGIANMSTVANCAVAGYTVEYTPNGTQTQEVQIGGLVGKNQGEIYNCSASNKRLAATGSSGDAARLIGGFAGDNKEGVIADCYSGGLLYAGGTQSAYVGGIVGKNEKGESRAWRPAYTQLLNCYSYCSMENNDSSNIHYYGVAGGNNSDSYVKHCHFYNELSCFKDYSKDDHPFTALYNKLSDKSAQYTATIRGNTVVIPYALTYVKMKALSRGNAYALSGTTGTAEFDHSWPYDQTLVGGFPFAAVVLDDDGYYVHYGDWPAPIGTIFSNSTSFGGVFWADFCVDATHKTDYNYYWGDWLKEMMYQCGLGDFKEGDYIEIIVEPEFKYDAPEAGGLFQCAVHSMLTDTSKNVWDDENDAAYEAQGITFGNGQVYQFLFDVDKQTINILNDPQLWFAVNYHQKGGIDASLWDGVKGNYFDEDGEPAGNEDPFRINRLTVNVYRDSSSTSTSNQTTRHSTTTLAEGETTSVEEATHLETLKTWDFEPVNGVPANNILSTGEGSMVAGVISDDLYAGSAASGHSNMISLNKAKDFRMNISDAFNNEPILGKNEYYQVEATFALGDNATDNLYIRPYLVSGSDSYYASTFTLVQKRAETGANAGKVIWATGVYTFGREGVAIDDDAYIVWIPREVGDQTNPKTLSGDLYVDNVAVKKVVPGADPSATASTKPTVPASDDEAKLIYYWACDQASTIVLPTYDVSPKNTYRYINVGGKDLTTGVSWSDFLKMHDSLTETQYMVVTLEYPEGYAHAQKSNFTFTCDAYAYGDNQTLAEIDAASGDDAFDAENRTVKWVINGPINRSAGANYGGAVTLKTYFAYRNAEDLLTSRTLIDNEKDFNISVGIYDRDPNATAMTIPTTTASRTTKQLSGGTAVHTWASDTLGTSNYMTVGGGDAGYVDGDRNTVMSWQEFANYVGALSDGQYMRITLNNTDAPFGGLDPAAQSVNLNTYRGVDGKVIRGEVAKSVTANTVVYQINGPMDLNTVATDGAKEGYNDAGFVFAGMADGHGEIRVGDKTSILVEIMSTATTAQLRGDSFDVLAGDVISKTVTLTLNGDNFSSALVMNSDVTDWFTGLGGRGLSAKLIAVSGNEAQISIVGTVSETPSSDVTVTATIPGDATAMGGNDVVASGSFIISKKVPKASIVGEEKARSFFVNEAGQAVVNISVSNTVFGSTSGIAESAWFEGTLPAGLSLTQVAKINDNTVTLTFSGTPTEQASVPLNFKVPAAAVACGTDLTAGTLTFNVVSRPTVDTPIFSLAEGTYKGTRTVTISCNTADALVEYKLGESGEWTMYVNPIVLTEGETTVYARATKTDYLPSAVVHATYTIEHDDNLLKNGYFYDGLDGWTVSHSDMVSVENGVLTVTNYHSGNDLQIVASLKDGVTLKPHTKYRLSFNMNVDNENLKVKVVPGGNKSTSYTASGSYEFETTEEAALSTFMIYISSPKYLADSTGNDIFVNGTFDNFELSEVGGTTPTTPTESSQTETSQSQTEPIVTSQPESSTTSETSETSEPTGDRTKKAQWVTTAGVSYAYYKKNDATAQVQVWENCSGKKDGTTDMTWREFLASVGNVSANQYFEIAFTHVDGSSFYGVSNNGQKTTLSNTGYSPSGTTLLSASDAKVLFETNGALSYQGLSNPRLEAAFIEATGAPKNTDVICTVTLWEGDHGGSGGETSESETSESETSTSETSETSEPETYTNLIVNGNFANALNGWTQNVPAEGDYAGFFTVSGGALHVDIPTYRSVSLIASYTEPLKPSTEYTLHVDMTTSGSANDKITVKIKKDNNHSETMTSTGNITFETPSDLTNFQISVSVAGNSTGLETAVIDNFILVEGDHIPDIDDPNPPVTETYTVTVTGGNADKTTAAVGETITLTPPTTAPEGQEFKGWKVTAGGVTVTNNTFTMPAANVTIEAEYQYIEYSITVYNGNANGKTTAHVGETIQLNAGAPETGKVFAGWTVTSPAGLTLADASATMTTFTMPAADVVVEAAMNWVEHNVTIHVNNDAWGSASIATGVTKAHYGEQLTLTVSPEAGYELSAISVKNNVTTVGADNKFSMVDSDVDIYVDFVKSVVPTHNVTITGGIVNGGTGAATIAEGETVTITASDPSTGYAFTGWTVTSPSGLSLVSTTASTTSFTMPKADVAITANFEKQNYNVTCGTVQDGTISANKTTAQYGDAVTLTATPATGYVFKSWSVNGGTLDSASANPATLTMPAADVVVTATFEKETYAVTVSNDTTKGTASANVSTAAYGDTVTLTASAKTGYIFSGWTSSDVTITGSGSTSASFLMPAKAVTVTANYVVDTNAAIASWTSKAGIFGVNYTGGTATLNVAYNTTGLDNNNSEIKFEDFVNSNTSIGASQYMKITYTAASGHAFGNARRASTALAMNAYSGGSYKVYSANDNTIVVYVKGTANKTTDPSFATSWTNASGVPGNIDVTCKVEIFNFTTDPLASISEADKTQNYTVTVTGGTASPASAAPGTSVTVTATVPSGQRFTGWTVDGTDYLYDATVEPGSTTNPLTFTMPYNNVKLTANFETAETEPTQPTPTDGNLLKNGDFMITDSGNSNFGWVFPGGMNRTETSAGTFSIKNGNSGSLGMYQDVALTAGTQYTLSLNLNVASGPLDIRLYNSTAGTYTSVGSVPTGTNGTYTCTFTAAAGDNRIMLGGYQMDYTITSASLTAGGSTPVTEPSETTPTQSQPSGGKYSLSSTLSLNKTNDTTLVDNLVTPIQYNAGETATFQIVIQKVYQPTNKGDAGLRALVPIKANGVDLAASSWEIGADQGSNNFTVTFTYNVTMNADTVISGLIGEGYHGTVTVSAGGGDTPTQPTTQAPKYKVTLGSVTGGTISASKTTDVAEGETITLTATPASGYTFGGWNVTGATVANASNATTTFTMPKGDVTVSATFNEDTPAPAGNLLSSTWSDPSGILTVSGNTLTMAGGKNDNNIYQDLNVQVGKTYMLTGDFVNSFDMAVAIKVNGHDAVTHKYGQEISVAAGATQSISMTIEVKDSGTVSLKIGAQWPAGTLTITNLQLVEVS